MRNASATQQAGSAAFRKRIRRRIAGTEKFTPPLAKFDAEPRPRAGFSVLVHELPRSISVADDSNQFACRFRAEAAHRVAVC